MFANNHIIAEVFLRSLIWLLFPGKRSQEVLMLRKELQVLSRQVKRPRLKPSDRLLFIALKRQGSGVIARLITIKPGTVLEWHRRLVAKKWNYGKRAVGRPAVDDEVRRLVVEMKRNNRRWGARRIKGRVEKNRHRVVKVDHPEHS